MAGSAASVWELGGMSVKQLGKQSAVKASEADITGRAAQLAYYFFLALFPLLLATLSMLALMAGKNSSLQQNLISSVSRFAPGDAASLISRTLQQVFQAAGGWKAVLGIIGALWSASSGVSALMDTLNSA